MDGIILAKLHTDTNAFYTHFKTSLSNNNWKRLDAAIAFARNDGIELIIDQLSALSRSIPIRIVVGIDFKMTTYEALHSFLTKLDTKSEIWIFNDQSEACFHPKIYLFTGGKVAKLFIGSANLTRSGIIKNHEAMLEIDVDLARPDSLTFYNEVYFRIENWANPHNKHSQRLTNKYLDILLSNGYVMRESEVLMKRQKESKIKYEKWKEK